MQVTNDYPVNHQTNFRGGRIDAGGLKVLSDRLPSGQFQKFVEKFEERHKDSNYKIILGAAVGIKGRLDAMIEYGKDHFRYIEEGVFSSKLFSPKNFMKKINQQIRKDVNSIATKGFLV